MAFRVDAESMTGSRPAPGVEAERSLPVAVARVPALSYFFPAHNEAANLRGLVAEALAVLPQLAIPPVDGRIIDGHELVRYIGNARRLTDDYAPVDQLVLSV